MNQYIIEMKYNALNRPYFVLKNQSGKIIIVSESFADRIACERNIIDVRENATIAQLMEDGENGDNPRLQIQEYLPGKFQFILYDLQNEILLISEGFCDCNTCKAQMKVFKESFAQAKIVDLL